MAIKIDKQSKFIILAPHPDDELHMAYSWIKDYPQNTIIAIFTTGKAGTDESNLGLVSSGLVSERYKESIMGMSSIGINPEQVLFFAFNDGREDENLTIKNEINRIKQFSQTIEYLQLRFNPQFFISPLPIEVHIDHSYIGYALMNANVKAKKLFSCYPKSIEVPLPDFEIPLTSEQLRDRVILCNENYTTQSFLCRKLENKEFHVDRYWYADSIERFIGERNMFQVFPIKNIRDKKIFNDLFDTEDQKRHRVSLSLTEKYINDADPWKYKTSFYEKKRIEIIGSIINRTYGKGVRIIDIGCGNGELLKQLNQLGFKFLEGTDVFTVPKRSNNIRFKIEDFATTIKRIHQGNGSDVILLSDVVYYIHFLEFKKLSRLLSVPSILFCGGEYEDIRPYLIILLEYYQVVDGEVLEYHRKQTFFLNLKKKTNNNVDKN